MVPHRIRKWRQVTGNTKAGSGRGRRGCAAFAVLAAALGLLAFVAWATMKQAWTDGQPWHSAFVAEHWATPVTAFIAATAAVTTAWWTVSVTRAAAQAEESRWEDEKERWREDRHAAWDQARDLRTREVERTLRDRFHELARLLSSEQARARQAAAYSLVALSDDWAAHHGPGTNKARAEQQVCINTLIAQLLDPIEDEESGGVLVEIVALKHVVQKLIIERLDIDHPNSWSSFNFSFDRCIFHDWSGGIEHTAPTLTFNGAQFAGEYTSFESAKISSGYVSFREAVFKGIASFDAAKFAGRVIVFDRAVFRSGTNMRGVKMEDIDTLSLNDARLDSGFVDVTELQVRARLISLMGASFENQEVELVGACLEADRINAMDARLSKCELKSGGARIKANKLDFSWAEFSDARISAHCMTLVADSVDFEKTRFNGTLIDISGSELSFPRSELLERLDDGGKLTEDAAKYNGDVR